MLSLLKKLKSTTPAPTPVQVAAPVQNKVDPYMLGLHDAMLSGWFNQETGELFKGFPVSADDTLIDVGCGDGGNVQFCGRRGAKIIVADIDAAKVEATRLRRPWRRRSTPICSACTTRCSAAGSISRPASCSPVSR